MSRKSLILCLTALAVLILGTGVAVAFLYSGLDSDAKTRSSQVSDQSRYMLLSAVPSDAVLVACFAKEGMLDSKVAVSMHYSGKLMPLYIYDAGKASQVPSDEAAVLLDELQKKGMTVEYVDCSETAGGNGKISERSIVVASESDVLVQSALRHLGRSMSVLDAPGFTGASSLAYGQDVLFISNAHASYLMQAVFTRKYSSYSGFISRLADWTVFDISCPDGRMALNGSVSYGKDASEYMTVLSKSVPAVSTLSKVLPSYTLFALTLPVGDLDGYVGAYKAYLDSRQELQKNNSRQKTLAGKAGVSPYEFMKAIDVREVASVSFEAGGKLQKVNLIRPGHDRPEIVFKGVEGATGKHYKPAVHSWPYASFVSSVFGRMFELEDESCFTWIDGWIVSGSMAGVEEYVSGKALEYTLEQYMANASQADLLTRRKSSCMAYFSFSEGDDMLGDIFTERFRKFAAPLYEGAEYSPMVMSVGAGKNGLTLSAELMKLTLQKTKAPVFERDTVVVVPKGPFEVKNSGTGKTDKFYQNSHLSLCLSEDGKDLWGVPFKEPLCGTAYNVDYFANGKLQIIFGAGSSIYIIDRLGRYVKGFPVDLKKDILIGPDVYDFNGTRKYNIMVLHKDNTVEMYNLKGEQPASWKGIRPEETVKALPERITAGGSSYWVVRTSMQTLVYPFYGGEPLTKFEGDQMLRPDSDIAVLDDVTLEGMSYDGKKRTVRIK